MGDDLKLFWASGSPFCFRTMITLEEKNLGGYTSRLLSFEKKELKLPELVNLNHRGQVTQLQTYTKLNMSNVQTIIIVYEVSDFTMNVIIIII